MTEPLFSIISFAGDAQDASSWNDLKLTGKSLLQQIDAPQFEWVIIDAAPCDKKADLIREWDRDFIRYVAKPAAGLSPRLSQALPQILPLGHNYGMEMATGKYLWFLPAGDCLSDLYVLRDLRRELSLHPHADLVYGDARDHGIIHKPRAFESLQHRPIVAFQAMLFHRTHIGATRWNETLTYSADYDFMLHAQQQTRHIHYMPRLLCDIDSPVLTAEQYRQLLQEQHTIRAEKLQLPVWKNMFFYYRDRLFSRRRHP